MKVNLIRTRQINTKNQAPTFEANPFVSTACFLDERILLGKAVLDVAAFNAPQIIMANNSQERREKI